jgi:hypothetical protein
MRDYQPSFTGGEIAPELHARVDLQRYGNSLKLAKNFNIKPQGGIISRPGMEHVYDAGAVSRLIPFEFNTEQAYVLAFTNLEMRVIKDNAVVLEGDKAITGITTGGVVTIATHLYVNGQEVYIKDTGTSLDNRFWTISSVTTNTFATGGDGTGWVSGGTAARVFVMVTTYVEADLFRLKYTQSADVLTITHPSYAVRNITRSAHDNWTIAVVAFQSNMTAPSNVQTASVGSQDADSSTDAQTFRYVVTSVNEDDGDESGPSDTVTTRFSVTRTATLGISISWVDVGASYYNVYKENAPNSDVFGFIGEAEYEGRTFTITNITAAANPVFTMSATLTDVKQDMTIRMTGITGHALYTAYNDKFWEIDPDPSGATFTLRNPTTTATASTFSGGGTMTLLPQFHDFILGPDMSRTPPIQNNPFGALNKYPVTTSYYQQRLVFAGANLYPQTTWMTRSSDFNNMDYSRPLRADDSITVALASQQVNEIRHIVPMTDLMILTSGGEWAMKGDDTGVIKPTNVRAVRQGSRGSSHVRPLEIGGSVLFVQNYFSRVRDLAYSFEADKAVSSDLSLLAEHLFREKEIVDWCYQEEPSSIVWAVRDDGVLLSMTYIKEQQVSGWSQHETNGLVKAVTSIPEGGSTAVYLCVQRTVNGVSSYFWERLRPRNWANDREAFCVDAGLTYRGDVHVVSGVVRGATTVVSSTAHGMSNGDVVFLRDIVGTIELNDKRFKVASALGNSFRITDLDNRDISSTLYTDYVSGGEIQVCTLTISNLHHLANEPVAILADGNVVPDETVSSTGVVTLATYAHLVHIGFGYNCDFETLPVDFLGQDVIQSRKASIPRVAMRVRGTRGLSGGKDVNNLNEIKERSVSIGYSDIPTQDGVKYLGMRTTWSNDGQIYIRQKYPLPAEILSIIPEVSISSQ